MPFEVVQPSKSSPSIFAAENFTLEWFGACVLSFVSLEVLLACERLVAAFAAERPDVPTHMIAANSTC